MFEQQFLETKIGEWVKETAYLAKIAKTQPHAAYAAFTHGLISRWTYTLKVCSHTPEGALRPLEEVISNELIPNLTRQPSPNELTRQFLALPSWRTRID